VDVSAVHRRNGNGGLLFQRMTLSGTGNQAIVPAGCRIDLQIDVRVETPVNDVELSVVVETPEGICVCECSSGPTLGRIARLDPGTYRLNCGIDENLLNPGRYVLSVIARSGQRVIDDVARAMPFEIAWNREGAVSGREHGLVRLGSTWTPPAPTP
jgi:hypothetical protein